VVVALAVSAVSVPMERAVASGGVTVRVYRLASNNGALERSGAPQWMLQTDDGRVRSVVGDPGVRSGARITLPGSALGKGPVSASMVRRAAHNPDHEVVTIGGKLVPNRRLTIVPFQWGGSSWTETDTKNTRDILGVLVPWWKRMSAGLETLNATIAPVLDANATFGSVDSCRSSRTDATDDMLNASLKHLDRTGLGRSFDNVMVLFPAGAPSCGWGGIGSLGGGATWTYAKPKYAHVWAHELGHNLGFPHANLCRTGYAMTYLQDCANVEYGNFLDPMGNGWATPFEATFYSPALLRSAKWLPDEKMALWPGIATTYTLQRPDRADLGQTAVQIPASDPASGDNTFWLQYNPGPLDGMEVTDSVRSGGVVLTMSPSDRFWEKRMQVDLGDSVVSMFPWAFLCDLASGTAVDWQGRKDPRILPGTSHTDPRNRFTVTVLSADGTSARVRVEPVGAPAVATPAGVVATLDPDGARRVHVTVTGAQPGRDEPVLYRVDTVEDTAKSCTFDAFESGCSLVGLSRNTPYTVRLVGVNGSARSSPVLSPTVSLPTSPPAFDVRLTPLSSSIVAKVAVDDGGSPPTSPLTLELPGKPTCTLSTTTETECRFDGLNPRTTYVLTARGTNATGTRAVEFSARTAVAVPEMPKVTAAFEGADLVLTTTAVSTDALNVTHFLVDCHDWKSIAYDSGPVPMEPGTLSATFRVPSVRGKYVRCSAVAIASDADSGGGYETSDAPMIEANVKGRIRISRIVVKVSLTSTKKGTVVVKWSTTGAVERPWTVVRTTRKKACIKLTARSCVVKGLKSRSTFTAIVVAGDGLGQVSTKKTVVVK